jgi:hypothetical protein
MNSNSNSGQEQGGKPDSVEFGEKDLFELEKEKANQCEPGSFKYFLINEYSKTILEEIVTLETLKDYKLAIYFYLYRINSYLFTGIDNDFNSDTYGDIELPYEFFHNLKLADILRVQAATVQAGITPQQIALQRLVTIYESVIDPETNEFDGFSEQGKWDYLIQLITAILYFIYCNKHYEEEITSNILGIGINEDGIVEDFPEIYTGCIGGIILHSNLNPKKIDSVNNMGLSKMKFGSTASGRHYSQAPPSLPSITFNGINDTEKSLQNLFNVSTGKPITRFEKFKVRNNLNQTFDKKRKEKEYIADDIEFPLNATEITDPNEKEYVDNAIKKNRTDSENYKKQRDNSNNTFKQYNENFIGAKDYCSDYSKSEGWEFTEGEGWEFIEGKGWKPPEDRWGTYSFPCYNERLLDYLNRCFPGDQQITTEDEYNALVLENISSIDNGSHLFKLEQKYQDTTINFMLEIFKYFLCKNSLQLSPGNLIELKKLFFCYFYYREAGDIKNKVLPDHIYHARVIHTLFSCVFGNNYDLIDFSCNNIVDKTDIPQSQIQEFIDKYTIRSTANSQANSQSYSQANSQVSLPKFTPTFGTLQEEELYNELLKHTEPEKGGTRKRKKGNKKGKKTRKIRKKTKKFKKITKKTKKLKKMK